MRSGLCVLALDPDLIRPTAAGWRSWTQWMEQSDSCFIAVKMSGMGGLSFMFFSRLR